VIADSNVLVSILNYGPIYSKSFLRVNPNREEFVKSRRIPFSVIPADSMSSPGGILFLPVLLDPGVRRGDGFKGFLRLHQSWRAKPCHDSMELFSVAAGRCKHRGRIKMRLSLPANR
jgi:hypothetical protein